MAGSPPAYQTPPQDALFQQLTQTATNDQNKALEAQSAGDTASLMARYGSLVAISGAAPSLTVASPSTSTPSTLPMAQQLALGMGPFATAGVQALSAKAA